MSSEWHVKTLTTITATGIKILIKLHEIGSVDPDDAVYHFTEQKRDQKHLPTSAQTH